MECKNSGFSKIYQTYFYKKLSQEGIFGQKAADFNAILDRMGKNR